MARFPVSSHLCGESARLGDFPERRRGTVVERCRSLAQGLATSPWFSTNGNNSAENLEWVGNSPFHFVGSLVPTQHKDLLRISRKAMRRLDPTQLPAVWSYRTRKGSSESSAPSSALQPKALRLPDADPFPRDRQAQTEITGTQDPPGKIAAPIPQGKSAHRRGSSEELKVILRGRHMADLSAAQVRQNRAGLPRLSFRFRDKAYQHLRLRHYWARPCFSPTEPTGPMSRSFLPYAPTPRRG